MPDGALGVGRNLLEGAARLHGERHLLEDVRLIFGPRRLVVGLEQEPSFLTLARALAHAHEVPASSQLLAVQAEPEVALLETSVRILLRLPTAPVPQQHRPAAVLAFRDSALEGPVIEGMVLGVHGQALFARDQARPLGDRPALEDAIELEAEIVVQARRIVFLDAEAEAASRGNLARWLGGFLEIPLGVVFVEQLGHYGESNGWAATPFHLDCWFERR
jgi:hypothetical protein